MVNHKSEESNSAVPLPPDPSNEDPQTENEKQRAAKLALLQQAADASDGIVWVAMDSCDWERAVHLLPSDYFAREMAIAHSCGPEGHVAFQITAKGKGDLQSDQMTWKLSVSDALGGVTEELFRAVVHHPDLSDPKQRAFLQDNPQFLDSLWSLFNQHNLPIDKHLTPIRQKGKPRDLVETELLAIAASGASCGEQKDWATILKCSAPTVTRVIQNSQALQAWKNATGQAPKEAGAEALCDANLYPEEYGYRDADRQYMGPGGNPDRFQERGVTGHGRQLRSDQESVINDFARRLHERGLHNAAKIFLDLTDKEYQLYLADQKSEDLWRKVDRESEHGVTIGDHVRWLNKRGLHNAAKIFLDLTDKNLQLCLTNDKRTDAWRDLNRVSEQDLMQKRALFPEWSLDAFVAGQFSSFITEYTKKGEGEAKGKGRCPQEHKKILWGHSDPFPKEEMA
jgi:hypothetical protein